MIYDLPIEKILFLDIETVPNWPNYEVMPEKFKLLWNKKAGYLKRDDEETPESLYDRAGIYAEFGKIICVSSGFLSQGKFRIKSFFGEDEYALLKDFAYMLDTYYNKPDALLCAHNGKEFDFPYLSRRMLINGIKLPGPLNIAGKKPWEIAHIDTMELWKFGDFKNYTSLDLLTTVFGIPTPKDDINGADIKKVFWEDNDLDRIVTYCQKDVLAIAQLFLKYQGKDLIKDEDMIIVE